MNFVDQYFNTWVDLLEKAKHVTDSNRKSFVTELNNYSKGWQRLSIENQGAICEKIRIYYVSL